MNNVLRIKRNGFRKHGGEGKETSRLPLRQERKIRDGEKSQNTLPSKFVSEQMWENLCISFVCYLRFTILDC